VSPEPASAPSVEPDAARVVLDAVFAEHAARERLPSIAWGLVEHGQLIASGGEGDRAVYRIASMTKSFTAAAVLILRDERRLRLDDPISEYAPELAHVGRPTRDSPAITLRHLLTMSSGLATDDAWADRHMDVSDEELDRWLAAGTTSAGAPGTMFEYSNLGYGLLGRVVWRVTGAPVQRLISDRLLVSLGMGDTTWAAPPSAAIGYHRRTHDGVENLVEERFVGDGVIAPMGGLFSTVADLAKWIGFFTDAFPARDDPDEGVLSRASRREMQQASRGFSDQVGGYGMGLNVVHHAAGTVVTHSGGLPGFGSNMRWLPAHGLGLVALANHTYAPMAVATRAALDALVEAGLVSPARRSVTDGLRHAAEALVRLHNGWDDEVATTLFADNVFLDEPAPALRRAAQELHDEHGPFTLARVIVESATSATAVAHGPHCELHIDFQLTPTVPSLVQTYETKLAT